MQTEHRYSREEAPDTDTEVDTAAAVAVADTVEAGMAGADTTAVADMADRVAAAVAVVVDSILPLVHSLCVLCRCMAVVVDWHRWVAAVAGMNCSVEGRQESALFHPEADYPAQPHRQGEEVAAAAAAVVLHSTPPVIVSPVAALYSYLCVDWSKGTLEREGYASCCSRAPHRF